MTTQPDNYDNPWKEVTSVERLAIERGGQQGNLEGQANILMRQLTKRFGPLSPDTAQRPQTTTTEQLDMWVDRILDVPTLTGVSDAH